MITEHIPTTLYLVVSHLLFEPFCADLFNFFSSSIIHVHKSAQMFKCADDNLCKYHSINYIINLPEAAFMLPLYCYSFTSPFENDYPAFSNYRLVLSFKILCKWNTILCILLVLAFFHPKLCL